MKLRYFRCSVVIKLCVEIYPKIRLLVKHNSCVWGLFSYYADRWKLWWYLNCNINIDFVTVNGYLESNLKQLAVLNKGDPLVRGFPLRKALALSLSISLPLSPLYGLLNGNGVLYVTVGLSVCLNANCSNRVAFLHE